MNCLDTNNRFNGLVMCQHMLLLLILYFQLSSNDAAHDGLSLANYVESKPMESGNRGIFHNMIKRNVGDNEIDGVDINNTGSTTQTPLNVVDYITSQHAGQDSSVSVLQLEKTTQPMTNTTGSTGNMTSVEQTQETRRLIDNVIQASSSVTTSSQANQNNSTIGISLPTNSTSSSSEGSVTVTNATVIKGHSDRTASAIAVLSTVNSTPLNNRSVSDPVTHLSSDKTTTVILTEHLPNTNPTVFVDGSTTVTTSTTKGHTLLSTRDTSMIHSELSNKTTMSFSSSSVTPNGQSISPSSVPAKLPLTTQDGALQQNNETFYNTTMISTTGSSTTASGVILPNPNSGLGDTSGITTINTSTISVDQTTTSPINESSSDISPLPEPEPTPSTEETHMLITPSTKNDNGSTVIEVEPNENGTTAARLHTTTSVGHLGSDSTLQGVGGTTTHTTIRNSTQHITQSTKTSSINTIGFSKPESEYAANKTLNGTTESHSNTHTPEKETTTSFLGTQAGISTQAAQSSTLHPRTPKSIPTSEPEENTSSFEPKTTTHILRPQTNTTRSVPGTSTPFTKHNTETPISVPEVHSPSTETSSSSNTKTFTPYSGNVLTSLSTEHHYSTPSSEPNSFTSTSKPEGNTRSSVPGDYTPSSGPYYSTASSKHEDYTTTFKPEDSDPISKPGDTSPTSEPDDTSPISEPEDTTVISKPEYSTPYSEHEDNTPSVEPAESTPSVEPEEYTPGEAEPEFNFDVFAEPGPDWPVAKLEWKQAWEFHIYFFGAAFTILGFYCLFCIIQMWKMDKLLSRHYFMTLQVLVMLICIFRASYLLIDAYNSLGTFPVVLDYFLYSTVFPCLTAVFSILFYALLLAVRVRVISEKVQKLWVLLSIIGFHFALSFTTDVLVGLFSTAAVMLLICQAFFILWGLIIFVGYLIIFKRLYNGAISRQDALRRHIAHERKNNLTQGFQEMIPKQKYRLGLAVKVTLVSSIFGLACVCFELYGMLGVYGVMREEKPEPWPWWIYHFILRCLEIAMCSSVAYVASQPLKYTFKKKYRDHVCLKALPCRYLCCAELTSHPDDLGNISLDNYAVSETDHLGWLKKMKLKKFSSPEPCAPYPPHTAEKYSDPDATLLVRKINKPRPSMLVVEDGFVRIKRDDEMIPGNHYDLDNISKSSSDVNHASASSPGVTYTINETHGSPVAHTRLPEGVANAGFSQEDNRTSLQEDIRNSFHGNGDHDNDTADETDIDIAVTDCENSDGYETPVPLSDDSLDNSEDIFRPLSNIDLAASMESELERAFHPRYGDEPARHKEKHLGKISYKKTLSGSGLNGPSHTDDDWSDSSDGACRTPESGLLRRPIRRCKSAESQGEQSVRTFDKNKYLSLSSIDSVGKNEIPTTEL